MKINGQRGGGLLGIDLPSLHNQAKKKLGDSVNLICTCNMLKPLLEESKKRRAQIMKRRIYENPLKKGTILSTMK